MLAIDLYKDYCYIDSMGKSHGSTKKLLKLKVEKHEKIYDIRSWRKQLESLPVQYETDIYELVKCMKLLITNRMTCVQGRGIKNMSFLGASMQNRFCKDVSTLLVGNKVIDIRDTQVLDASLRGFSADRYETVTYINSLKELERQGSLTFQHIFALQFPDNYASVLQKYIMRFQSFLSADIKLSLRHLCENNKEVTSLLLTDLNDNGVNIFENTNLTAQDYVIILLLYLLLYENVHHRTIYIDSAGLSDVVLNCVLSFVKEKVFQPVTVVLY